MVAVAMLSTVAPHSGEVPVLPPVASPAFFGQYAVLGLEMSDHGIDCGASLELAFDLRRDATLLAGGVDLEPGRVGERLGESVAGTHPLLTRFGIGPIALRRAESSWAPCSCRASSALNAATFCSASASPAAVPRTCAMSS